MRARGLLETGDDGIIFRAAKPIRDACSQYTRRELGRRAIPLARYHQHEPRAIALRPQEEFSQREESLLAAHAVQVDLGFGRGAATRELLPQPPFDGRRPHRWRGLRRSFRSGSRWRLERRLAGMLRPVVELSWWALGRTAGPRCNAARDFKP